MRFAYNFFSTESTGFFLLAFNGFHRDLSESALKSVVLSTGRDEQILCGMAVSLSYYGGENVYGKEKCETVSFEWSTRVGAQRFFTVSQKRR